MKITEMRIGRISVPLIVPFTTALRSVNSVEDILVEIHTDEGLIGYGEAAPNAVVTGDTPESIAAAIRHQIAKFVLGRDLDEFASILQDVQKSCIHNTAAKAAVDIALHDLFGKYLKVPTYKMLGACRRQITTDITISVNDPETMARDTKNAVDRGYRTLKVKVGIDPGLDVERLQAVRKTAGGDVDIRIDANQAWKPKEAVRILMQMQDKGLNIELCEQPVHAGDLEGLKYVTDRSPVPVLADEAVFSPADALKIMQMRAADMVNIKLMKCGGLVPAQQIVSAAEVYGVECMIGCMLEAKISVNAAVHLACAKNIITKIDLDGPVLCKEDPILGGSVFREQEIRVSDSPGLGITGIENFIELHHIS